MKMLIGTLALVKREVVRFTRQKGRVVGALGTPLVFWFLIGSGIGNSFSATPGQNYLQFFFPGILVLILLFTAIFSTMSIIEDRQEGFLQGVLASSASRSTIVLGKILGGTVLALGQGILFMLLLPFLKISMSITQLLYVLGMMTIISFGLTGLGFLIAWKLNSSQGFHAIMNLFLMPMWFLSGALFPITNVPSWLKIIMLTNPLTYGMSAIHQGFFLGLSSPHVSISPMLCLGISLLFAIVTFSLSVVLVKKSS